MDISDLVSTEYVVQTPDTPVSKLIGAFEDPSVRAVVVTGDDGFEGVVTRRQLTPSHLNPDTNAGSVVWHVPRVAPGEDVREVARLMLDSDSQVLPVFEGEEMRGVVTADDILRDVREFLDAATVRDAYTADLETVSPDASFGEAVNRLREHRIAHLPVVENDRAVGILSLHDVTGLAARSVERSSGGDRGELAAGQSHGGFGAREGERDRLLDMPVRDVMSTPVRTIERDRTLADAVGEMFDVGGSALVVTDGDRPVGIVTKSDVLEALTWEAEGNRAVQVYGTDLLDDVTYEEIVGMIDAFDDRDGDMRVLDAKLHLHEHDEKLRGTPLLLARIRLYTDRGLFMASGEGYGASHAIHEARDVLERRLRDEKTYGQSKKHPDEAYWDRRFGWLLES